LREKIDLRKASNRARIQGTFLRSSARIYERDTKTVTGRLAGEWPLKSKSRLTAQKFNGSTGPKTKSGRHVSSRNALRHVLSCPLPMDEAVSIGGENLMLVHEGADDDQVVAARQLAQAQMDLSRVRMTRTRLMASLDLERCNFSELRRLMVIDRYERIARAKGWMAADKL
jgi:hypothetical protein